MTRFFLTRTPFSRTKRWLASGGIFVWTLIAAGSLSYSQAFKPEEKYWADPTTGFAIGGYDVVSYWSSAGPVLGKDAYEVQMEKTTWRFSNKGNFEEFRKYAGVYTPQFSGYGAYAVSQGKAPRGNPRIWVIADNRLYLFFSLKGKKKWLEKQQESIRKAIENWPALRRQIARPN